MLLDAQATQQSQHKPHDDQCSTHCTIIHEPLDELMHKLFHVLYSLQSPMPQAAGFRSERNFALKY